MKYFSSNNTASKEKKVFPTTNVSNTVVATAQPSQHSHPNITAVAVYISHSLYVSEHVIAITVLDSKKKNKKSLEKNTEWNGVLRGNFCDFARLTKP